MMIDALEQIATHGDIFHRSGEPSQDDVRRARRWLARLVKRRWPINENTSIALYYHDATAPELPVEMQGTTEEKAAMEMITGGVRINAKGNAVQVYLLCAYFPEANRLVVWPGPYTRFERALGNDA